jgi:hypothetical protein
MLAAMDRELEQVMPAVRGLVDRYRAQCLWFWRADYYPADRAAVLRALNRIQRYGDRQAFQEAGQVKQWLSRISNAVSAG